jgi:hypothetical protein
MDSLNAPNLTPLTVQYLFNTQEMDNLSAVSRQLRWLYPALM